MTEMKKTGSAAASNTAVLLFLAACPAMGASVDVRSAFVMGLCVLILAVLTAIILSVLRGVLSGNGVIAAAVIVSAGFASIMIMLLRAFVPAVYSVIWMYLGLCCVNMMLISQSERGVKEAVKACVVFFAAIILTALLREFFGAGSIAGAAIPFMENYKISILTQAPGGFIVFALVMSAFSGLSAGKMKGE